jgi:preprotein translocase subunit SecA
LAALIHAVTACHATGRPVLIGTGSIAESELISRALAAHGIAHEVLNARHHACEAALIARAGRLSAVTVVTAMGGRGVDIRLGGESAAEHETVVSLGGLYVAGVTLYATRRLELHLRGRAGRQGDPGESVFFLSLDDDEVRAAFRPRDVERFARQLADGHAVDPTLVTTRLEGALNTATANRVSALIHHLTYDAVLAEQRAALYARRRAILDGRISPRKSGRCSTRPSAPTSPGPIRGIPALTSYGPHYARSTR